MDGVDEGSFESVSARSKSAVNVDPSKKCGEVGNSAASWKRLEVSYQ